MHVIDHELRGDVTPSLRLYHLLVQLRLQGHTHTDAHTHTQIKF